MLRYVFRRLLTAIPTLFVIVTISFFLMRLAPGGPFNQEKGLNPVIKANLERHLAGDYTPNLPKPKQIASCGFWGCTSSSDVPLNSKKFWDEKDKAATK